MSLGKLFLLLTFRGKLNCTAQIVLIWRKNLSEETDIIYESFHIMSHLFKEECYQPVGIACLKMSAFSTCYIVHVLPMKAHFK